jgi:2-succinyl-5-enolpyruvyl-6-hydroxy-3-cyclohexene-1-carboxylate synthase
MVNEAILETGGNPSGPVHINVPIREPFYPDPGETFQYSKDLKIIRRSNYHRTISESLKSGIAEKLRSYQRILLVVGQGQWSEDVLKTLDDVQKHLRWVVLGDVIGNIHSLEHAITYHELILINGSLANDLSPDLLITIGQSVLSKGLKNLLRDHKPSAHWHIGDQLGLVDTFQCLSDLYTVDPYSFLQGMLQHPATPRSSQMDYFDLWYSNQKRCRDRFSDFWETATQGEYRAVKDILSALPDDCVLHLANSMPVRYVNYLGIPERLKGVEVWSNRGTSGIDGCTSTMVGHAINSEKLHILLTGDVAFFYDRNGLWHQHVPDNVRIIVLNNHGGGIFRLIDGPRQQPELEECFEAKQVLGVKNTARDFGFTFYHVGDLVELADILPRLFDAATGKAILEIETDSQTNQEVFDAFRNFFRKR